MQWQPGALRVCRSPDIVEVGLEAEEYSIQHRPNNQNPEMIGKDLKTVMLFAGVRAIPQIWMMK